MSRDVQKKSKQKGNASIEEKVKEIKRRQENWMKQRTDHKSKTENRDSSNLISNESDEECNFSESKNQNLRNSDVKNRFKHWLNKQSVVNDSVSVDDESEGYYIDNYRQKTPYSDDEIDSLKSKLLTTEDFDTKADSIVKRVRKDLKLSNEDDVSEPALRSLSCADSKQYKQKNLSSHCCPSCHQSMGLGHQSPMLLIPCGHSACRRCSGTMALCPVCNCNITSAASNIMLQQIIQDYNEQQSQGSLPRHHSAQQMSHSEYSSSRYADPPRESGTRKVDVDREGYAEELSNIITRISILKTEQVSIKDNIHEIDQRLASEDQQKRNVAKQKANVLSKIEELKEKLNVLAIHEEEYEEMCAILLEEKSGLSEKLSLLNSTLSSLSKEAEKIQVLLNSKDY